MGAAGRDFHNFNVYFRDNPSFEVVCFTATQIPFIEKRTYPPELAGGLYPQGIPIHPEERLAELIREHSADMVVFAYSDVSHEYVMHRAELVCSLGANFALLGAEKTMLSARKPVISVCAVRTGCGKSGVTEFIAILLKRRKIEPVVIRHPMPYGNLLKERVQRFATLSDIDQQGCTIEEREEFEHLVEQGILVYAGVDYGEILKMAEEEADILLWDGGNNDLPFVKPTLELVVADPFRKGDELKYHPGEANLRRADHVIINKTNTARREDVEELKRNIQSVNPEAGIIETSSVIYAEDPESIRGKTVIVVEDGPTLTHGGMPLGAGTLMAKEYGARIVDPAPYAAGTIKETLTRYSHLKGVLPAMGYSSQQIGELEETINNTPADLVLVATPVDLIKLININKPAVRVRYRIEDHTGMLERVIEDFLKEHF